MTTTTWIEIQSWDVPPRVRRWDTPSHLQGQILEVSYGAFGRAEAGDDSLYKREVDRSTGVTKYYRRAEAPR